MMSPTAMLLKEPNKLRQQGKTTDEEHAVLKELILSGNQREEAVARRMISGQFGGRPGGKWGGRVVERGRGRWGQIDAATDSA